MLLDLAAPRGGHRQFHGVKVTWILKLYEDEGLISNTRKLLDVLKRVLCVDWPECITVCECDKSSLYCPIA
jgi:hypothetical protein